jgi:hypothetical protein
MILSKIVVNLYSVLLEIGLWLMLLIGLVQGANLGGWMGAIGGLVASALIGATFFGAFLVLDDIRKKVAALESKQASVVVTAPSE